MTTPYITLTIDQVRQIRKAIDDSILQHHDQDVSLNCRTEVDDLQAASKILSDELECLRYL